MNKMQSQVHDFKVALNGTDDLDVCHALIEEEASELLTAIEVATKYSFIKAVVRDTNPQQLTAIVDGMCDLIYVVFYLAEVMHIDIEPYFDEVQRTNMLKEIGTGDHKIRKPEGWQPPRIAEMLAKEVGLIP